MTIPAPLTEKSLASAAIYLAQRDPELAAILGSCGPPPMWGRQPGFPTLVRIILEQQVSLSAAASIFERLRKHATPLKPSRLLELGENGLRTLGLTRQKSAYCIDLSQLLVDKRLNLSALVHLSDADARSALMEVKGIGSWSADIYLLMALRRPDVWPGNDLALVNAIMQVKGLKRRPSQPELLEIAETWRPFRSVAARMLWQHYLKRRMKDEG